MSNAAVVSAQLTRPPCSSTLFPYRRSSDLGQAKLHGIAHGRANHSVSDAGVAAGGVNDGFAATSRSEEHTSELQSLRHLVCRLLLEKKIGNFALDREHVDERPILMLSPERR